MTYEGFKYIQLKQNSQQKCEHLLMLELLVTYLNLLGMRNGGRKGNQNHQSYYIFTHVNFTIKGENFKLHRTYQWICTDSQAEKTLAPGGGLILEGNKCVGFSSLWLVRFALPLILVVLLVFWCFILSFFIFLLKTHQTEVY